jgi:hypothetical protein
MKKVEEKPPEIDFLDFVEMEGDRNVFIGSQSSHASESREIILVFPV